LFRRFPYWILLLTSLLLWALSGWRSYNGKRELQPQEMAKAIGDDLENKEARLKKLLENKVLLQKVFDQKLQAPDIKTLQELPFYFYAYDGHTLYFWNNNAVIIDSAIKKTSSDLLILDRGVFVRHIINAPAPFGANMITVLFPIASYYPFENKYIHSSVAAGDNIPLATEFTKEAAKGAYPIKNTKGTTEFYAHFPEGFVTEWTPDNITLILLLLAAITTIAWIQLSARYLTLKKGNWALLFVMLAIVIGLRSLLYLFGLPFGLQNISFFSPQIYASNWFLNSLGDVVINILCLLWLYIIFLRYTPYRALCDKVRDGTQKTGLAVLFTLLSVGFVYTLSHLIITLVIDSKLSFELSRFGTTDTLTIIGLLTIATAAFLACISVFVMNIYLNHRA
jgi:hypothetical protein